MDEISLKGKDIVIVGLQPWYFPTGCNAKDIAVRLSRHNRVLYVNFPLKRKAYFARDTDPMIRQHVHILRQKEEKLRVVAPNIWEYYPPSLIESVNWLPYTQAHKAVNYFNNRRLAGDIRRAISQLGFKEIILFNDNDIYNGFYLKELLTPSLYIYYFRDFLQGYDYWKKHTSILEPQLLRKSDLVVANSIYYAEYSKEYNPNSYYIGQGCNLQAFDHQKTGPPPAELQDLKRPLVGYIGALDTARLDEDIIRVIARSIPTCTVVLVGPEDDRFKQSDLHTLPNILFTGGKPFDQLSAFVGSFDVCINPQLQNQITKGNYPLKIDEYLAMGKPVVATRTTAMEAFKDHTYLAGSPDEYPGLILKAIAENDSRKEAERIAFAHSHTWENSVDELSRAIIRTLNDKSHKTRHRTTIV